MARNLFVLSALSLVLVGCFGPEKAPSPVSDGAPAFNGPAVIDNLTPVAPVPVTPVAPANKATKTTAAKKSTGKLPIGNNAGNK
jgi:hypothetical protein